MRQDIQKSTTLYHPGPKTTSPMGGIYYHPGKIMGGRLPPILVHYHPWWVVAESPILGYGFEPTRPKKCIAFEFMTMYNVM